MFYSQTFVVEALIPGCTDSTASNYNPLANIDDSSCCYIMLNQNDTIICQGDQVILDLDLPSSSYLWSTGETTSSITVSPNSSSFYWVLTDNNCYNSITIFVNLLLILLILLQGVIHMNGMVQHISLQVSTQIFIPMLMAVIVLLLLT